MFLDLPQKLCVCVCVAELQTDAHRARNVTASGATRRLPGYQFRYNAIRFIDVYLNNQPSKILYIYIFDDISQSLMTTIITMVKFNQQVFASIDVLNTSRLLRYNSIHHSTNNSLTLFPACCFAVQSSVATFRHVFFKLVGALCSSFRNENDHQILICSLLSTAQQGPPVSNIH